MMNLVKMCICLQVHSKNEHLILFFNTLEEEVVSIYASQEFKLSLGLFEVISIYTSF